MSYLVMTSISGACPGWPVRRMIREKRLPSVLRTYSTTSSPAVSLSITTSSRISAMSLWFCRIAFASRAECACRKLSLRPAKLNSSSASLLTVCTCSSSSTTRRFQTWRAIGGAAAVLRAASNCRDSLMLHLLLGGAREAHGEARAVPRAGGDFDGAAENLMHQVVDDVHAKAAAAGAALGGEERVEDAREMLGGHAAAVVGVVDRDLAAGLDHLDLDASMLIGRECVDQRIADQVGQDLGERAGEAVDDQRLRAAQRHRVTGLAQAGTEADQHFLDVLLQREAAPLAARLVDRDLLEAADQVRGAIEVGEDDARRLVGDRHEPLDVGRREHAGLVPLHELRALRLQRRRRGDADADRRVDLVRHARDQRAER